MESAVLSSLLDNGQDPLRSWFCPPEFRLGIGDEWEDPFAPSFETTAEQDEFIIQASQQLDGCILQVPPEQGTATGVLSPRRLNDADVDDLLLIANQALESATGNENALCIH